MFDEEYCHGNTTMKSINNNLHNYTAVGYIQGIFSICLGADKTRPIPSINSFKINLYKQPTWT